MNTSRKIVLSLVAVIGVAIVMYYFGFAHYFSLESIKIQASFFKAKVESNYTGSVFTFIAVFTTLIALTLPLTGPMGIIAGFLFGLMPGIIYSMIAAMIGTTISYIVVRKAMTHIVRNKHKHKLNSFNDRIQKYGYSYLISLQLLTVVPYFIINTLAALGGVPLWAFMWTTFAGSLPIVAIYTFAGRELYMIKQWSDILSVHMLALLLVLAVLSLMPIIVKKFRNTDMLDEDEPIEDDEIIEDEQS